MGKIFCAVCQRKCRGDVLKIGANYVHKECFQCAKCQKNLEQGGFFLKDKRYYCPVDYQESFGVRCGMCHQFVEGDVVTMLGNTFHTHCFRCQSCSKPFQSGDRATLWEGEYLCRSCSLHRQEKENVSPVSLLGSSPRSSTGLSPLPGPSGGVRDPSPHHHRRPQLNTMLNGGGDTVTSTPINGHLSVHVSDTGYTSTDSGADKMRSEVGYFSQPSPCYSLSSGEESSTRIHTRTRQHSGPYDTKYPVDYGKFYKVSYLRLESDQSGPSSPREKDRFKRQTSPAIGHTPKSPHFHRPRDRSLPPPHTYHRSRQPKNFSYRSSPTHTLNLKKAQTSPRSTTTRTPRSSSPATSLNSEEPIRLAAYPAGHEPDSKNLPAIERYDWPAPPSPAVVMVDRRHERFLSHPTGDTSSVDGQSIGGRSHGSQYSSHRLESDIDTLRRTANLSGMSKAMIQDLESARKERAKSPDLDPISCSRTPNATKEPGFKTRYEKHVFASPSRDNRRDRRENHSLSYPLEYSSTGGRSGTLPSCPSTPRPGYTQGYLQGSSRTASLPRHVMDFSEMSYVDSRPSDDIMDGQISPFTTSGYSVDGGHSGYDAPVISGYMSAGEHHHHPHSTPQRRRHRDYDSSVDLAYPSVQSWLRPSSFLKMKDPLPPNSGSDSDNGQSYDRKIYPYERLKITSFDVPKDIDRNKLEQHLTDADFHSLFEMSRQAFTRLPEWKRNDLKRRLHLF